jgi:hypothetical protein
LWRFTVDEKFYLTYDGDEAEIGTVQHGIDAHAAFVILDDIVSDMKMNLKDAVKVTISIR